MRRKAGDIFFKRDGSGEKTTFADAFPEIESLTAEISEEGPGNTGLGARRFHRNSYREFVNCSNVQCSGHGAPTGPLLRRLVETRQKRFEDRLPCQGHLETGCSCSNTFTVRIDIVYK